MLYNNITTVCGYWAWCHCKVLITDMPKNEFEEAGDHLGLSPIIASENSNTHPNVEFKMLWTETNTRSGSYKNKNKEIKYNHFFY